MRAAEKQRQLLETLRNRVKKLTPIVQREQGTLGNDEKLYELLTEDALIKNRWNNPVINNRAKLAKAKRELAAMEGG